MRINQRLSTEHTYQAQASHGAGRVRRAGAGAVSGTGAKSAAVGNVRLDGAYQLAHPIADLIQAARTGKVSPSEFGQNLSDIASRQVSTDMPASEQARAIHLVSRIASLENQLVDRLQTGSGAGSAQPAAIDQMIDDWASRFATDRGVALRKPVEPNPGSLLDGRA